MFAHFHGVNVLALLVLNAECVGCFLGKMNRVPVWLPRLE